MLFRSARGMLTIVEFTDAIIVPSFGVEKTDDGYKVFVADEVSGSVSSRIVEVAYVTTDYTVIDRGLEEGEIVVAESPQELKDGMPVKIIDIQENALE